MKKLVFLVLICALGLAGCSKGGEEKWDMIPMVMVDGTLYLDTGHKNTDIRKCGVLDGEITSTVDGTEKPAKDNQSNFGSGYGYQYGATEGTIEIYMNDAWCIFATEEVRQQIQFPEKESDKTSNQGADPSVVKTYEKTDSEHAFENDELCILVEHYEMSDGTWKTETHTYKYRLEITGRMSNAATDSTFVFLSNIENITFEQAWKAAGFSSNRDDYFDTEEARLVGLK